MKADKVDTLILGCTHFPHLSEIIQDIMGDDVKLISSGAELAKFAVDKLLENGDSNNSGKPGIRKLYCTVSVELFTENTDTFLGKDNNAQISKCVLKT